MKKQVKIFFPIDVSSLKEAYRLMEEVGHLIDVPKIGLELISNVGLPHAINVAAEFRKPPFADVKLIDIPATVEGAAKGIVSHGVAYFNVMALGGKDMMAKAVEGAAKKAKELDISRPKIIAVTILTSLGYENLASLGLVPSSIPLTSLQSEEEQQEVITAAVIRLAYLAVAAGVDCILSSPREVVEIRKRWADIEIICPGIRPPWAPADDQKRTMTPYEAVKAGADGLVIGRPIRKPPEGMTREETVKKISEDIQRALDEI